MWYLILISIVIIIFCWIVPIRNNEIKKKKKYIIKIRTDDICFLIISILLFSLTAFRGASIGNDTGSYLHIFKDLLLRGTFFYDAQYEIGYQAFNLLVGKISSNPQAIIIASTTFIYFLVLRYFKKNCDVPFFALALFFGLFFSSFTNIIRHAMASCILLYAYEAVIEKKIYKSLILVIIATTFQTTALVFFPYVIIRFFNIKFAPKLFTIVSFAMIIMTFSSDFLLSIITGVVGSFNEYYLVYLVGNRVGSGKLGIILSIMILLILWSVYMYTVPKKYRTENEKWLFGFCFGFYILAFMMNLFSRIAGFFELILIVIVVNGILSSYKRNKRIIICGVVFCILISFLAKVILRPEWNNLYPYCFYWQ